MLKLNRKGLVVMLVPLALMLALTGCISPSSASAPETSVSTGDSDTDLARFVKRLFNYHYSSLGEPKILPGELPSDLAVDIPIPETAEIIGSLVQSDKSKKYENVQIILDVPGEPEDALAFYQEQLAETGWHEFERYSSSRQGGFVPSQQPVSATFCRYENKGPSLSVITYAPEGKPTDVRLSLVNDPQSGMCSQERNDPRPGGFGEPFPSLKAPEGALQTGGSSGGSGNSRRASAELETELGLEELQAHYQQQLEATEWKLEDQGSGDALAWSTWSFTDDSGSEWAGLFMVRAFGEDTVSHLNLWADMVRLGENASQSYMSGGSWEVREVQTEVRQIQ